MNPSIPMPDEPFDFTKISETNLDNLKTYVQIVIGRMDPELIDDATRQKVGKLPLEAMSATLAALTEVKRLYTVLDSMRRTHLPFAGEPGAAAVCTSCSMHGGQVPWPCEVYLVADKALPERMPA